MLELIQKGGPTMWLISVFSVAATVIFLERLFHLHRAQIGSKDFLKGIYNVLQRRNVVEAVSICEETPGPVPHIVRAAVLHHDEDRETIRQAIQQAGQVEVPRLERNLNLLATIAQVSPLLGLLGTVGGMMNVLFAIEARAPLVHAGDLTGGLWQALISTAAGLAVGIGAYMAHNFLLGRVESILQDMEQSGAEILTFLLNRQHREDRPPA